MKTFNVSSIVLTTLLILSTFHAKSAEFIRDTKAKKGLFFQVKIEGFVLDDQLYNRFETVDQFSTTHSEYNYRLGVFTTYKKAKQEVSSLNNKGIQQASVVAYFNRVPITLEEAMVLTNNQMKFENELMVDGYKISVEDLNKILFENEGLVQLEYKIHTGLYISPTEITSLKNDTKVLLEENEQGFFFYKVGNFTSKSDAIEYRKILVNQGVNEAFVVPYFNGKRVSLELAQKLENLNQINVAKVNP